MVGEESKSCRLKHHQTDGLVDKASVFIVALN